MIAESDRGNETTKKPSVQSQAAADRSRTLERLRESYYHSAVAMLEEGWLGGASDRRRRAAAEYLDLGWRIVPACWSEGRPWDWSPVAKSNLDKAEKHHWRSWGPRRGIELVLGELSGVVAVECESWTAYRSLLSRLGSPPPTPTFRWGGWPERRYTFLFRIPDEGPLIKAIHFLWRRGIQVFGEGALLPVAGRIRTSHERAELEQPRF